MPYGCIDGTFDIYTKWSTWCLRGKSKSLTNAPIGTSRRPCAMRLDKLCTATRRCTVRRLTRSISLASLIDTYGIGPCDRDGGG